MTQKAIKEFDALVYKDRQEFYPAGIAKRIPCGSEFVKEVLITTSYEENCPWGAEEGTELPKDTAWAGAITVVKLRLPHGEYVWVKKSDYDTNYPKCTDCCIDPPTLDAPENFVATAGDEQVSLDWDDVPNAENYVVERATDNGFSNATVIYEGADSEYVDNTGLVNDTEYFYRVKAKATYYTDSGYSYLSATPLDPQLAIPANFTITPGSTQNAADWDDVPNATGYELEQDTDFTFGTAANIYTGAASDHTETGLVADTPYYYRVRATAPGYRASEWAYATGTPTV